MFKKVSIVVALILILNIVLRLLPLQNYHFAFTWDQARDVIDLRRLVFGHHPLLVGPTTGLTGVFLGPFWYYLNAPLYILMRGDPVSLVVTEIIIYLSAGIFTYLHFKKFRPFNLILSFTFLFTPLYFHTTHYSLNPNLLPPFFLVIFVLLPEFTSKTIWQKFLFFGVLIGLSLQIEAAMAVMFFPVVFVYLFIHRLPWQKITSLTLGFLVTLIPQFLYELVHHFPMTRLLLNQFTGKQDYLTNKLSSSSKFLDLVSNYKQSLSFAFQIPWYIPAIFLSIFLVYLLKQRAEIPEKLKKVLQLMLLFFPLSFFFYLIYPFRIYLWYLHSLGIIYVFVCSLSIYIATKINNKSSVGFITGVLFFSFLFLHGTLWQINYVKENSFPSTNASSLNNRLAVINWIYQKANKQGFEVYTYSPAVYDLQSNYLFWWYGNQLGYRPNTVSFQKETSHYLPDNQLYWTNTLDLKPKHFTFLIFEPGTQPLYPKETWLTQFTDLCIQETKQFDFQTQASAYLPCHK
jgi:hypothetical protein